MTEQHSDYVRGAFLEPTGEPLISTNPSRGGEPVASILVSPSRVDEAVHAAMAALGPWSRLSFAERWAHLERFQKAIDAKKEWLADGIVQEIGKLRSEARTEIASLLGRFALVKGQIENDLKEGSLPGFPSEALRWHPHGVVAVIGPFNFPLHLCHAHVIPALLLGNTVVMKPSEIAPLTAIRYAQVAQEAGLPPGVLNVIHGRAATGMALVAHPHVHALAFTGSWPVGRRIAEAVLDKPDMLIALEMGGKNTAIVCEDADLRQVAHELIVGGYLTTGQRCTCTDRVLVHRSRKAALVEALVPLVRSLRFGDPDDVSCFAGPLATEAGLLKLERAIAAARAAGAEAPVEGARGGGGFFRSASFHVLPDGVHDIPGYTDTELFGPDLGIETFASDDEAIALINGSPYGFANSVFTLDDARFEKLYRETRVGILNRNRSTNQASPRLPFGGTGRSGNFRPAGSFAPRNLAIPVAVQSNAAFALPVLPALAPHLPDPDLEALERLHQHEEAVEAERTFLTHPRPLRPLKPKATGVRFPQSTAWLERFTAAERTVREKKPVLFDHLRSKGVHYVSIDDEPLSVVDAMSQTATMPFGFNEDALVEAYVEGAFGSAVFGPSPIESTSGRAAAEAYADVLRRLVPGLPTVCFTACGAEANEKAFALCMAARPGAKKLLAFEGSFHGRTMLSLYASHSPSKRVPFEIAGYEVGFAPLPVWMSPGAPGPADHDAMREAAAGANMTSLATLAKTDDALLAAEAAALLAVAERLQAEPHFAVVIEPMQSEGGDRYATPRFHRALRLLTRALGVPLIMDEVQCGFGLGGPFAWHHGFGLTDPNGAPDTPDCVIFAKRAQVGVVLSRFPDPEPTEAGTASLVRGRLHAELLGTNQDAARVEQAIRIRLSELRARWGHLIEQPRVTGYAFAFEVPTPAHLNAYLMQRFARGAIVFAAGERTVRYRLHARFSEADLAFLFATIHQSLAWLEAHGWTRTSQGVAASEWDAIPLPMAPPAAIAKPSTFVAGSLVVREALASEKDLWMPQILALEARVYEPARRDPEERLRQGFTDPHGVAIVATAKDEAGVETLVGSAIAVPLECVAEMEGPDRDSHLGKHDTLYTVALTIDPRAEGLGLGRKLKAAQLEAARSKRTASGAPRYLWNVGRNRVGLADPMIRINDHLGASTVALLTQQYGEPDGVSRYYRQPVHALRAPQSEGTDTVLTSRAFPFAKPLASLTLADARGLLAGPAVNKLTLVNYVTPAIVRATEQAAALVPSLPHVFFTSGRDETLDKSIRMLRMARKSGRIVIGLEGGYVGHTTAAARSVSDPDTHRQGAPYFDWPRVPHPAEAGVETSLRAIEQLMGQHGEGAILGLVVEPVGERSGLVLPEAFVEALGALRARTKIPVVFVETASAYYRSGRGAFASSPWSRAHSLPGGGSFVPDLLTWWTGGQHGYVHVSTPYFVSTPLTFVSTWDGDELAMIQAEHALWEARRLDTAALAERFGSAVEVFVERAGITAAGLGLHRVLHAGLQAAEVEARLARAGIRVRATPRGTLVVAPAYDQTERWIDALASA